MREIRGYPSGVRKHLVDGSITVLVYYGKCNRSGFGVTESGPEVVTSGSGTEVTV